MTKLDENKMKPTQRAGRGYPGIPGKVWLAHPACCLQGSAGLRQSEGRRLWKREIADAGQSRHIDTVLKAPGAANSNRRPQAHERGGATELLKDVLDAFAQRDVERARAVWERDVELDALEDSVFRDLLTHMIEDPETVFYLITGSSPPG